MADPAPHALAAPLALAALVVAAGRGARSGQAGPKQYARLGGEAVIARTLRAFEAHPAVARVLCVIHPDDEAAFREAAGPHAAFCHGGADRQASVRLGLEALAADAPDGVLIHDAARPFVSAETIARVAEAVSAGRAAIAALPASDTLKRAGGDGAVAATLPRDGVWRAQTPQGFPFAQILAAHRAAAPGSATDDASLLEARGEPVALIQDAPGNFKLTYPEDFVMAERMLGAPAFETRTGMGYDVHAFGPGDRVTLGGVAIPHTHALVGHSDADVVMHALADALYGAMAEGDIGRHFPPSEEKWRGAPSSVFLSHAAKLLAARGGRLVCADVTVVCEAPKITPHAPAMTAALAEAMGCEASRVSVKATTTERLGFTGRKEGIAVQAVCSVEVPR